MRIGKPLDERDIPHGVTQKLVDFPSTKEANGDGARFGKLWVSELSQFNSVIFIDHDVLVRKPLDFLFDIAEQLPDTLVAPRAYWIKQPYMMSGG
jgi:alpha-N-acetylglucosamine transferase